MKITDALKDEHRILSARLDSLERLLDAGAPLADLRTAAALLSGGLLSHAHLEDDLLFPALEAHMGAGNGPLAVMRAEHQEIERGLATLGARQSAEEVRETLAQVLQVARQHFAKEDEVLFPMAEDVLDGGALEGLGAELLRRRGDHPLAPA
jgi:regulator of cell morphogenesis and NO signaling